MAGDHGRIDSVGREGFVAEFGGFSKEQQDLADGLPARLEDQDIRTVRIAWPDQHGIPRGKFVYRPRFLTMPAQRLRLLRPPSLVMDTTNRPLPAGVLEAGAGFGIPEMTGFRT